MPTLMAWYNYKTREYDYLGKITPDMDMSSYVPYPVGEKLYEIYTQHKGMSNLEAVMKILNIAIGNES